MRWRSEPKTLDKVFCFPWSNYILLEKREIEKSSKHSFSAFLESILSRVNFRCMIFSPVHQTNLEWFWNDSFKFTLKQNFVTQNVSALVDCQSKNYRSPASLPSVGKEVFPLSSTAWIIRIQRKSLIIGTDSLYPFPKRRPPFKTWMPRSSDISALGAF